MFGEPGRSDGVAKTRSGSVVASVVSGGRALTIDIDPSLTRKTSRRCARRASGKRRHPRSFGGINKTKSHPRQPLPFRAQAAKGNDVGVVWHRLQHTSLLEKLTNVDARATGRLHRMEGRRVSSGMADETARAGNGATYAKHALMQGARPTVGQFHLDGGDTIWPPVLCFGGWRRL